MVDLRSSKTVLGVNFTHFILYFKWKIVQIKKIRQNFDIDIQISFLSNSDWNWRGFNTNTENGANWNWSNDKSRLHSLWFNWIWTRTRIKFDLRREFLEGINLPFNEKPQNYRFRVGDFFQAVESRQHLHICNLQRSPETHLFAATYVKCSRIYKCLK